MPPEGYIYPVEDSGQYIYHYCPDCRANHYLDREYIEQGIYLLEVYANGGK